MNEQLTALQLPASPLTTILDAGIVWGAALVVALAFAVSFARRCGLDPRAMYWASVCAIVGGIWGSHLLGLLIHGADGQPFAWLRVWTGGKSYYGGVFGGALAGAVYLRRRGRSLLSYADAVVPAVALGYAIGRVGCFLNGDDYGTVSGVPWAVRYAAHTEAYAAHLSRGWIGASDEWSLPIHPVQLYSSLTGVALCILLARRRTSFDGQRFCLFALFYGATRFLLEWLRGDFQPSFGSLSLPQVCSLLLATVGACVWLTMRAAAATTGRGKTSHRQLSAPSVSSLSAHVKL